MTDSKRLVLCLWCAGSPCWLLGQPAPSPMIRDSAGVRIVEYGSLRNSPMFKIQQDAYLHLGGVQADPKDELDARQWFLGATELSNGTIVVNELTSLKFFTAAGRFVRSVGRQGQGPGEFVQTREVCRLLGDSLLVIDYSNGSLSLWDSAGTHVRTFARPGFVPRGACAPDGSVVARRIKPGSGGTESAVQLVNHALVRRDGSTILELGLLPSDQYAGSVMRESSIVVDGGNLVVADGRRFEFLIRSLSGRPRLIVRSAETPRPITDLEWQRRAESMVPRGTPFFQRQASVARTMAMDRPVAFPAIQQIRVDPLHRIWVQDFESERWTVFDSRGALLGAFSLPRRTGSMRAMLAGIGTDHVVVHTIDTDGAAHLSFYRILVDGR